MLVVRLEALTVDQNLQPRVGGIDAAHVAALQECPDQWPPVTVVQRDGRSVLIDGFHRLAAAQNLGLEVLRVDVLPMPEDGDLHGLAFALNATHGRPLSLADRRAFAMHLLRDHPEWADREIGRRAGLSSNTVGKIRENLVVREEIVEPDYRVGAGGYVFDASTHRQANQPTDSEVAVPGDPATYTAEDRRAQRALVDWLRGLAAVYREGSERMAGWRSADSVADAVRLVLGDATAVRLGEVLTVGSRVVAAVAEALRVREEGDRPS